MILEPVVGPLRIVTDNIGQLRLDISRFFRDGFQRFLRLLRAGLGTVGKRIQNLLYALFRLCDFLFRDGHLIYLLLQPVTGERIGKRSLRLVPCRLHRSGRLAIPTLQIVQCLLRVGQIETGRALLDFVPRLREVAGRKILERVEDRRCRILDSLKIFHDVARDRIHDAPKQNHFHDLRSDDFKDRLNAVPQPLKDLSNAVDRPLQTGCHRSRIRHGIRGLRHRIGGGQDRSHDRESDLLFEISKRIIELRNPALKRQGSSSSASFEFGSQLFQNNLLRSHRIPRLYHLLDEILLAFGEADARTLERIYALDRIIQSLTQHDGGTLQLFGARNPAAVHGRCHIQNRLRGGLERRGFDIRERKQHRLCARDHVIIDSRELGQASGHFIQLVARETGGVSGGIQRGRELRLRTLVFHRFVNRTTEDVAK